MSNQVYARTEKKYISRQPNEYFLTNDTNVAASATVPIVMTALSSNRGEYAALGAGDNKIVINEEGIYNVLFQCVINESSDPNVDRDFSIWINNITQSNKKIALHVDRNIGKGTDPGVAYYAVSANVSLYLQEAEELSFNVENMLAGVPDIVLRSSTTDQANYTYVLITKLD